MWGKHHEQNNKSIRTSFSAGLVLAGCGQKQDSTATTQAQAQAKTETTTAAPTTATPITQVASNKKETTEALPKDGEAVYRKEEKGRTITLKYYFKDDIVYKQDAVYTFNPKEMGKTEEEIQKILKKRQDLYDGVKGFVTTISQKDGIYIHNLKIDYNNVDREELHRRDPKGFPNTKSENLIYSESVKKLLGNGYVQQ